MSKVKKKEPRQISSSENTSRSIILKQPTTWSRGIALGIVGVTVASIVWSYFAQIEQVVTATGKLVPQGQVREISIPLSGVIKEVYVKDGDRVTKGQLLAVLDSRGFKAQLDSLEKVNQLLENENIFYRKILDKNPSSQSSQYVQQLITTLKIPQEIANMVINRINLQKENNLLQLGLGNITTANYQSLSKEEKERLNVISMESASRIKAADFEVKQQFEQLRQTEERIVNDQKLVREDKIMIQQIKARNKKALAEAKIGLKIDKDLLDNMKPVYELGAIGDYQFQKQKQAFSDRSKELAQLERDGNIELIKQLQQLQSHQSEITQLTREKARLSFLVSQAQEKLKNSQAITQKDIRDKIAENTQKIAEIDSSLNKTIIENQKKLAENKGQIGQIEVNLEEEELRAPETGIVFDLKAKPGYVSSVSSDKPVMKIVPSGNLIAQVDITNQDIGFVNNGQKADVRIDTFPYSEFGDIKGEVYSVGSDALPPDETHKFYRFPAKVKLNSQTIKINKQLVNLQSGMAVTVNIKVTENRSVMSLLTGGMQSKIEGLKKVR